MLRCACTTHKGRATSLFSRSLITEASLVALPISYNKAIFNTHLAGIQYPFESVFGAIRKLIESLNTGQLLLMVFEV